jgi:hypothetical protein
MSQVSVVSICNVALLSLGANPINDLTETSVEAVACNALWDNARRSAIASNNWSFARKRLELAQDTVKPVFEYSYQYTLPADLLKLVLVYQDTDYKIEGRSIITNKPNCLIKYVYDNTDVTTWTDPFIDAMSARMRLELAYTLTRSNTQIQTSSQLYQAKLQTARTMDGQSDIPDRLGQVPPVLIAIRS